MHTALHKGEYMLGLTCLALRATKAVAVVLMLAPTGALAAFTPPITVSPSGGEAGQAQVAHRADGSSLIAWSSTDDVFYYVYARNRTSSGVLGPIRLLSRQSTLSVSPDIAIESSGDAYVVWQSFDGSRAWIEGRSFSAASALGPIQTISSGASDATAFALAGNASGEVVVSFLSQSSTNRVQARTRSAGGGLGPILTLSGGSGTFAPATIGDIAINAQGDAIAVWTESNSGATSGRALARQISDTGVLGAQIVVAPPGGLMGEARAAIDRRDRSIVAWTRVVGGSSSVQTRAISDAGVLASVRTHGSGTALSNLLLAANINGVTQLAWIDETADALLARAAANGTAGGVFTATATISAAGEAPNTADLAIEAVGDGRLIWYVPGTRDVRTRVHRRTGVLEGPVRASPDADINIALFNTPQVSVNASGDAAVVWFRDPTGSDNEIVQLSTGP